MREVGLVGRGHDPVARLRGSLLELTEFVRSLSSGEWSFHPAEGWSIPENCEHVLLVEKAVAEQLPKLTDSEPLEPQFASELEERMVAGVPVAKSKFTAPEPFRPTGVVVDREAFLAEFSRVRNGIIALAEADPGRWLRVRVTHPFLGVMDGRHRMLNVALHLERHLRQMERVRERVG